MTEPLVTAFAETLGDLEDTRRAGNYPHLGSARDIERLAANLLPRFLASPAFTEALARAIAAVKYEADPEDADRRWAARFAAAILAALTPEAQP